MWMWGDPKPLVRLMLYDFPSGFSSFFKKRKIITAWSGKKSSPRRLQIARLWQSFSLTRALNQEIEMAGSKKQAKKKAKKRTKKRTKKPTRKQPPALHGRKYIAGTGGITSVPITPVLSKEITLSIKVKYGPDDITPLEIASLLDSAVRAGFLKDAPQLEGARPILITNFFEQSDEDEMLIFEALSDAIEVARKELDSLKKVLESSS